MKISKITYPICMAISLIASLLILVLMAEPFFAGDNESLGFGITMLFSILMIDITFGLFHCFRYGSGFEIVCIFLILTCLFLIFNIIAIVSMIIFFKKTCKKAINNQSKIIV